MRTQLSSPFFLAWLSSEVLASPARSTIWTVPASSVLMVWRPWACFASNSSHSFIFCAQLNIYNELYARVLFHKCLFGKSFVYGGLGFSREFLFEVFVLCLPGFTSDESPWFCSFMRIPSSVCGVWNPSWGFPNIQVYLYCSSYVLSCNLSDTVFALFPPGCIVEFLYCERPSQLIHIRSISGGLL